MFISPLFQRLNYVQRFPLNSSVKLAQKDIDARWTKKHGTSHYGYQNYVSSNVGCKFIRRYAVTDASVYDSQVLGGFSMRIMAAMGSGRIVRISPC